MSVEAWKSLFDMLTVVLLGLTFLAGAGVLFTGNIVNNRQAGQLRQFNTDLTTAKTELSKQQERAAKAESQIAVANAASQDAVAKVATAEARVAEASAKAESFRLDIASANKMAGEANERSAELERENLILQQKLANRRITKPQHDFLVNFLSKKRGQVIIETMGDSESGLFAADILKTFEDSKWAIGGKHFPLGVVWTGLIVFDSKDPDALTIVQAFQAAGIPVSVGTEKRVKATIMIGGKPPIF